MLAFFIDFEIRLPATFNYVQRRDNSVGHLDSIILQMLTHREVEGWNI